MPEIELIMEYHWLVRYHVLQLYIGRKQNLTREAADGGFGLAQSCLRAQILIIQLK